MKNPTNWSHSNNKEYCSPVCHHSYSTCIPIGIGISNASFDRTKSVPNETLFYKTIAIFVVLKFTGVTISYLGLSTFYILKKNKPGENTWPKKPRVHTIQIDTFDILQFLKKLLWSLQHCLTCCFRNWVKDLINSNTIYNVTIVQLRNFIGRHGH